MQNRTDLALELKEEKNIGSAQSGIIVKTRIDTTNHIKETKIIIKNKKGEDSLGKPKGTYITIEAKDLSTNDGSFHKEMSDASGQMPVAIKFKGNVKQKEKNTDRRTWKCWCDSGFVRA